MIAAELRAALEGTPRRPRAERVRPATRTRACARSSRPTPVDFFGREAVTKRLIQSLAEDDPAARFLAVVGPSGSGKSSVVRAGLVPALRRGAIPGSERWYVDRGAARVAPVPRDRDRPPRRRRRAAALADGGARTRRARPRPSGRTRAPRPRRRAARSSLDQLEEIFTMIEDDAERARVPREPPRGRARTGRAGSAS